MTLKKALIGGALVVVIGVIGYVNVAYHRTTGTSVTTEQIGRRGLEAIVSASGKVQPQRHVDVSAETVGKVTNLVVNEGDMVKQGQLLLQIDPKTLESNVQNHQASLDTARSLLAQTQTQVDNAKIALKLSQDTFTRQEGLAKAGLISRDELDRAQSDLKTQETNLQVAEQSVQA